jgi:hypothetical protein
MQTAGHAIGDAKPCHTMPSASRSHPTYNIDQHGMGDRMPIKTMDDGNLPIAHANKSIESKI